MRSRCVKLLIALVGLLAAPMAACERAPSPEFQVTDFYASMKAQSPAAMRHVFENLLSEETRASLRRRSDRLARETGNPIAPWDVIVFRGFVRGDRISKQEIVEQTSDTARVKVHFAWYVPATDVEGKYQQPSPSPTLLYLVREGGQWRIHLPELVAALGS